MSQHTGHRAELNRASCANIILASLPSSARLTLLRNAKLIRLEQGLVVYGQGASNPDVLFPISGLLSGIDAGANGAPLATAFRGREGAYGVMMAANGPRAVDAAHEVVCERRLTVWLPMATGTLEFTECGRQLPVTRARGSR